MPHLLDTCVRYTQIRHHSSEYGVNAPRYTQKCASRALALNNGCACLRFVSASRLIRMLKREVPAEALPRREESSVLQTLACRPALGMGHHGLVHLGAADWYISHYALSAANLRIPHNPESWLARLAQLKQVPVQEQVCASCRLSLCASSTTRALWASSSSVAITKPRVTTIGAGRRGTVVAGGRVVPTQSRCGRPWKP